MRSVTALSTVFLMIVSSMAGCIEGLEDIAEAIGCSDENAANFDPDATTGSDDLCLFLENEARFMAVMGDAMAAEPSNYLLDSDSGVSGVEYSMSMSGDDPESGMSVSMEMLSVIMVDLESQSMYNRTMISYMDMINIDTEMVWSGTDIMVTTSIGGPMASEVGESGTTSSISRDMSPDLEEVVRGASFGMMGMMGMEDLLMPGALPGGDYDDDAHGDNDQGYEGEGTWIRDSRDTGRNVACTENIVPTDVTACTQWRSNYGHEEIVDFEVLANYEDKQEESSVWVVSDQGDDEAGEYLVSGDWYVKEGSGAIMWREDITPNDDWWNEEDGDEESDFEWFDRDRDGFVEMGEIETALYEEPSMPNEMADCIIDNVSPVFSNTDENDDQKLDENEFSEFDNYLENNFDIDEACGDSEASMDDMMPEGSSVSITHDEETGIQTMVMQTVDDTGDMAMTIRLHEDGSFHSYEMGMDDGESVMTMSFSYLTSEMVSIPEIDYTLDRTATPISVHAEPMMVCDNGELVPAWSVMDGWEDCEDGSDESLGPEPVRYSEVFSDLDIYGTGDLYDLTVTVYFEDANMNDDGDLVALMEERVDFNVVYEFDRELADGNTGTVFANMEQTSVGPLGQSEGGSSLSSSYTERAYFQSHMASYGTGPVGAEEGINSIEITILDRDDPNNNPLVLDDGVVEFDFNIIWVEEDANEGGEIGYWESYYDGYCGWEGNPDGDDTVWWCKISQTDSDWDNWWYYCEYHEYEDGYDAWHCTDDLGQSEDYEHSAGESLWSESDDSGDDDEICMWEDEHGIIHYGCDEEEELYDFPSVMHAHVVDQVANAPIADFELRMLDCDEGDMDAEDDMEDDSEPIWDECTVVMAFPLSGGEIDGVTVDYVDSDGDGMVSSGDISIVSGPVSEYEIQPYDTWAEEYSADSALIGQELPGFGAFLGVIGLLGAALAGREKDA